MSLYIMLILETTTILLVLHDISKEKIKFNIKTLFTMLVNIVFLLLVNKYQLPKAFTYISFLFYFIYCMWNLKASFLEAVKYLTIAIIEMTFIQFIWTCLLSVFEYTSANEWGAWVNFLTLLCCILIAVWREKRGRKVSNGKKNPMVYAGITFAVVIAMVMLFKVKVTNDFEPEMFVYAVVAIIFMLIFMEWYESYQIKCSELEHELKTKADYDESYRELVKDVRVRQHNINNQIATIMGTHYTAKTYEELVEYQEKYCGEIIQSNKFNSLIWLGDNVLAGFLYKKFTELEQQGTNVLYKADVRQMKAAVSIQYLIEMLGVLLDNAAEAIISEDYERTIRVNIREEYDCYRFEITNPYRKVPFAELEEWFSFGKSSKGKKRGVGLYRVKELCEEQECEIFCSNVNAGNVNCIKFELSVKKSG